MSVVRISGSLVDSVTSKVRSLHSSKIAAAKRSYKADWGERVYSVIMGRHEAQIAASGISKEFINHVEAINIAGIQSVTSSGAGPNIRLEIPAFDITGSNRVARPWPIDATRFTFDAGAKFNHYSGVWLYDSHEAAFGTLLQEIRDYDARVKAAEQQLNIENSTIVALLGRHSTLAPALREWPSLWVLLPSYVQKKHKELKKRETAASSPALDLSALENLTGQLVASILQGEDKED